jgi:PKD repeat protein
MERFGILARRLRGLRKSVFYSSMEKSHLQNSDLRGSRMPKEYSAFVSLVSMSFLLATTACRDESQGPSTQPEPPVDEAPEDALLAPINLIYVCGNKFLATNATKTPVEVTYRVVGSEESGTLTLQAPSRDDESQSETELKTRERGVVELYQNDQRVARRRNGALPCGPSPMSASVAGVTSAEAGSWEAPFPWPVVGLHLSLLPNGRVLSWGHEGQPQVWDPNTGNFTEVALPTEVFCAGHTLLPDGRLLVAGGHISDDHGLPGINIFSPNSQSWGSSTPMGRGRWYPATTLLANEQVVIMAGRDEAGTVVNVPEVWSEGAIRSLNTASLSLPYYPRTFLAPNGDVFYAGEQQMSRYLNTSGTGAWRNVGNRLYGTRDYGAAVMYDVGKILYVGGGRTTNTAEIIDLTAAAPVWQWTGSMANPRRHLNATVLPTGEVLVTGGSSGTGFNDVGMAVHAAELWNPPPAGTWTVLASNSVNRTYHATSILLPDGRILHTGSGDAAAAPAERTAELFSPPYLFKGARPTIMTAPTAIAYGTAFDVTTPDAATIASVSMIGLGSTTHAFDAGQRFRRLGFTRGAGTLTINAPGDARATPPGYYMLFLLTGEGVPSVAKIIRMGGTSEPPPPSNSAPAAAFSPSCTGLSCTFSDASTDADGTVTGWSWNFGDNTSATTRNPTHTYPSGGIYTVRLEAIDDDGATGSISKVITVTGSAPNSSPTAEFAQTCTGLSCTFSDRSTDADGSVTGWSWNFGDGGTTTIRSPSHTYASAGIKTVTLAATDDDGATATTSKSIFVTAPTLNSAPTAGFIVSCYKLLCQFTNRSTDPDGKVVAWRWAFGNGTTSTGINPNRTYAAGGTYTVTLRVTDDDGAANTVSQTITITSAITLTAVGRVDATKQYVTVRWSGARGTTVDLYRFRSLLKQEPNDGLYTASRPRPGLSRYTFYVCELGSTTRCSNEATILF